MHTILLVEDNDLNRDMLSRRLARRGYKVDIALDGGEGLQRATDTLPDVILLDMDLPVINGWEVARRLKSQDVTRPIPVIALTAHALTSDREKAIEAGCDDYETKPIEFEQLLRKIEALLAARV